MVPCTFTHGVVQHWSGTVKLVVRGRNAVAMLLMLIESLVLLEIEAEGVIGSTRPFSNMCFPSLKPHTTSWDIAQLRSSDGRISVAFEKVILHIGPHYSVLL